jgi:hypothetical protein
MSRPMLNATWGRAALSLLLLTGSVSACASLEPKPDPRVAELQRTVNHVAEIYNMRNPPTVINDDIYCKPEHPHCFSLLAPRTTAAYRPRYNEIVVRKKLLEPEQMRDITQVVLAHELAHYLLRHGPRAGSLDWYKDATYPQWERDANAKAVEILIRLGVPPDKALRRMYLVLRRVTPGPVHNACDEIADLLRRYPEHPADLTECASTTGTGKAEPAATSTK